MTETETKIKTEIRIEPETVPAGQTEVKFGVDLSRGFTEWLATKRLSLAITTYQVGKLNPVRPGRRGQAVEL